MGRQLLTLYNGVLIAILLGCQTCCVSATNRTNVSLPPIVLPNVTTTALINVINDTRTLPAVIEVTTPLLRNETEVVTTLQATTTAPEQFPRTTTEAAQHASTTTTVAAQPVHTTTLKSETTTTNAHHEVSHETTTVQSHHETTKPENEHATSHDPKNGNEDDDESDADNTEHSNGHTESSHHTTSHSVSGSPTDTYEPYSWWKIVVTLVIFCAMAGVILWILKLTQNSSCKKGSKYKDQSDIEDNSSEDSLNEKISTSRV